MPLPEDLYEGVFYVTQFTRGTALEKIVGVDRVRVEPWQCSRMHHHPIAETVIFIEHGSGIISIDFEDHAVSAGDRVCIPKEVDHNVRTFEQELVFTSIQVPAIHDESTGRHDVENTEQHDTPRKIDTFRPFF